MAQHQMSRRRRRLQRLNDGLGGTRRITRLFAAMFYGFSAVLACPFRKSYPDVLMM
jgi:hypothetical protein